MNKIALCVLSVFVATTLAYTGGELQECSTVVVSGLATPDGRPLLWKNRDTDQLSNRAIFVTDRPYSYLALVDAEDSSGMMVWAGLNSAGFAIANSVAYNLPRRSGEYADLEGIIMAAALRTCATIDDFETFVKCRLGPTLGSQANFCVIDAHGGSSIIETHNHGYKRIDAQEFPEKYIINTNYSRSGTPDQGAGYLRFDRETELFKAAPGKKITHEYILQFVARDLGHSLLVNPPRGEWKNFSPETPRWVHANHTINRVSTASAVVIQGVENGSDPGKAIMWLILGEPVCSIAVPLWVSAGSPPASLWQGEHASISREALRLKDILRPLKGRERKEYLDLTRLDNSAGTGWLPTFLESERTIFRETANLLQGNPLTQQLADFEKNTGNRILSTLKQVR